MFGKRFLEAIVGYYIVDCALDPILWKGIELKWRE